MQPKNDDIYQGTFNQAVVDKWLYKSKPQASHTYRGLC